MNSCGTRHLQEALNGNHSSLNIKISRQGPSVEQWTEFQNHSESGTDVVMSVRCPFWPINAQEWIDRPRQFGWPTSQDMSTIVAFGCHLVPVGHPNSNLRTEEWRISFSIAERILVWSFNHVQIQCYAVMKIILKEFIKLNCTPQNFMLCSYFIKTFLFWKFERTDSHFWCPDNFTECIRYLLVEFSNCLREGVIRHYFCPRFNLLSIKLTREAQVELSQLIDIVIQHDITIFKECRTLRKVWSKFESFDGNKISLENVIRKNNVIQNDVAIMSKVHEYIRVSTVVKWDDNSTSRILSLSFETPLLSFAFKCFQFQTLFKLSSYSSNKDTYRLHRMANSDELSIDISTCKLWYATLLYMKGDYTSVLRTVNQVLSSIPPYALYYSGGTICSRNQTKTLYTEMFLNSDMATAEKARTSWLFDLQFSRKCSDRVPLAIKIELYFSDSAYGVPISPFTFAYYMMFLSYHELCQYDNRERALRHLNDVVNNSEQRGISRHHAYNLVGHCFLAAGHINQARDMFSKSYQFTWHIPPHDKYNSASWYLHNFC